MNGNEPLFTDEEVRLMRKIGLDYDFAHPERLSNDEWVSIEDTVGDEWTLRCLDENYVPNADGIICQNILAKLP